MGLQVSDNWVEEEFANLDLGDGRINKRALFMLSKMQNAPKASLPQIFTTWSELKASYRLFESDLVNSKKLLSPHYEATLKRISKEEVILCPSDTSSFNYSSRDNTDNLSRLTKKNKGIWLHQTLALTRQRLCLGIIEANFWERPLDKPQITNAERDKLKVEDKESYRWIQSYKACCLIKEQYPQTQVINLLDREGDFIELFFEIEKLKKETVVADIIVRAQYDRVIEEKKLMLALKSSAKLGEIKFIAPSGNKTREVTQTIKATTVTFKGGRTKSGVVLPKMKINAVMAIEENPQESQNAIVWIFLTTLPIASFEEAYRVVEYYLCRWEVEIYFKILKSGCKVEEKQLEDAYNLKNMLSMFLIIAWRIMYVMMMGRTCPKISCEEIFTTSEWKSVYRILNRKSQFPKTAPSLGEFIIMIAQLGGYLNRKGDGPPGPKIMWEGISRMRDFALAWEAFTDCT